MNRRIWSLPINIIIFNLCRLYPFRNKNIWIYGAREGTKYDENSKYMFEYMNAYHKEIRSVWLTDNINTLIQLQEKGYETYLNHSIKGKYIQLRAGVSLYSHGLIDFGTFPLLGGTKLVALWHGMGFKKIYNGKYTGFKLKLKKRLDFFFSWTKRSLTPVTSEYAKKWANEMFTLNYDNIVITGQPRNDCFKTLSRNSILERIGLDPQMRIIIYMPTYRQSSMGTEAMEKIVSELYNSSDLDNVLRKTRTILLVKLHPLTPHIELINRDNFRILDYSEVDSNQELMGACDMLITDYSSCFVDYALLERPIIFYIPDEEKFLALSERMDDGFFVISNMNKATTPLELSKKIQFPSLAAVELTNKIFEDERIKGTCYSENVYNEICQIL